LDQAILESTQGVVKGVVKGRLRFWITIHRV
jgi:hypothetical protein